MGYGVHIIDAGFGGGFLGVFKCFLEVTMNIFNKINKIKSRCWGYAITAFVVLQFFPIRLLADDDPFGGTSITPDQLEGKAGSTMGTTFEYILIGIGTLACITCVMNIAKTVSRSADEKQEHGNSMKIILLNISGILIGFALIAIGWKGASQLAKSS